MTVILYAQLNIAFQKQWFATYLQSFPKDMQVKIQRYDRWQDQQAAVLGKLLLRKGVRQFHIYKDPLPLLQYTKYGRPSFSESVDFNISHSGDYVICALSNQVTLGIDIEIMQCIQPLDFKAQMTTEEWYTITRAPDQTLAFYRYWTQKEAVIKADGKGLSVPLDSFTIQNEMTTLGTHTWYTLPIAIDSKYSCHLATSQKIDTHQFSCTKVIFDAPTPEILYF